MARKTFFELSFGTGKHSVDGMGWATSQARVTRKIALAKREMRKK